MNRYLQLAALAIVFLLGVMMARSYYSDRTKKENTTEKATVLLEKIEEVSKLVSVEGQFSEVYDFKEYKSYDISMFRKKALVRVKAKVSAGYDLSKMAVHSDEATQTIRISNIPKIEILSIDHNLDYYDISEGTFNKFSEEDLNKINVRAKEFIESTAQESRLMEDARLQGNQVFELIRILVENSGWNLIIEDAPVVIDTLQN